MAAILYINLKAKTDWEKKIAKTFWENVFKVFQLERKYITPKTCLEITTSFILDKKCDDDFNTSLI